MMYRIVCIDTFEGYRPVTGWRTSPKGLQITADVLNSDYGTFATYWIEEGPARISVPIAKERAA